MKIGVFGDSFVDRKDQTWASMLGTVYGHDVHLFGESGSSLLWSARQVDHHAAEFDLVIWAVTNVGRYSVTRGQKNWHIVDPDIPIDDVEIDAKRIAFVEYLKHIYDWHDDSWQWNHIIQNMASKLGNLLLVPCFNEPLQVSTHLFGFCQLETKFHFPGQTMPEIYGKWLDGRPGHLHHENHSRLAADINNKLRPGMYKVDYELFIPPTEAKDRYWIKKSSFM